jgi:hypothetical protein
MPQLSELCFQVSVHQHIDGDRVSLKLPRVHIKLAMFDDPPRIGLSFDRCYRTDDLTSFCVTAVGLSFSPAVDKNEVLFFRRSGFDPAVLIRISSSSQQFISSFDHEESCGATLLAFDSELTPVRSNASKSEGRKYQRLPSWRPGIWPLRAMRFTVLGCSRRNRAASLQSQTGSGVEDAIFIDFSLPHKCCLAEHRRVGDRRNRGRRSSFRRSAQRRARHGTRPCLPLVRPDRLQSVPTMGKRCPSFGGQTQEFL